MNTIKRKPNFPYNMYEKELWKNSKLICGVDEVGRSCLAGPVVAAAVILKPNVKHKFLKDSKILTEQQRRIAYTWLMKNSTSALGIIHPKVIDKVNIYHATLKAMQRAVIQLYEQIYDKPSLILVDAMPLVIKHLNIPIISFCSGERQSKSIAAASIIAKVTRDAIMQRLDILLPGYSFASNKGYATIFHKSNIKQQGAIIIHRTSFLSFLEGKESD